MSPDYTGSPFYPQAKSSVEMCSIAGAILELQQPEQEDVVQYEGAGDRDFLVGGGMVVVAAEYR